MTLVIKLAREDVLRIVGEARPKGDRPDLSGASLSGANLEETHE